MQPTMPAEPTLILRAGSIAPIESLRLLWQLEASGYQVQLDGDELVITPGSRLTAQQRLDIRRHKRDLIALVQCGDEVVA